VAIDEAGRACGQWRGANTPAGWQDVQAWAAGLDAERRWGIEGAGQYGRGLAQRLVAQGEVVVEVNPRQTAAMRRGSRQRGKSDRLDALAVARVVRQDGDDLPTVQAEDVTTVLAVLVAEREGALAEATRRRNQLHQVLLHLDPERSWPDLTDPAAVARLKRACERSTDRVTAARGAAVRRLARRLDLALAQSAVLKQEIEPLARQHFAPLLTVSGVGALTAGMLAAALGAGQRFATDAQLAMYAGVAPLEVSSAQVQRHRLNRTGNRRLNSLLYHIAWVQSRCSAPARTYLARRRAEGKSRADARRCLKRFIARAVFQQWRLCFPRETPALIEERQGMRVEDRINPILHPITVLMNNLSSRAALDAPQSPRLRL
jgi:transposase